MAPIIAMEHADLILPWFTSQLWLLGLFLVSLLVFHILFVRIWSLSVIAWKRVDYAWLLLVLIGLIGTIASNRTLIAGNYLSNLGKPRIEGTLQLIQMAGRFGISNAICRKFVVSPYSPPPDVMKNEQDEFDNQCAWFKKLFPELEKLDMTNRTPIDLNRIAGKPPVGGEPWAYESLVESIASYNQTLERVAELEAEKKLSLFEQLLQLLGPSILAIALALRITKVSGEIVLERAKAHGNG